MGSRSRRTRKQNHQFNDAEVIEDTRKKFKKAQNFHLKQIQPLTDNQEQSFRSFWEGQNLVLHGCAGSGKTYISLYLGLNDLLKGDFKKIIIVRSAVMTRDQGFLPGTLQEKMAQYEVPYKDIFQDLFGRADAYDMFKKKNAVEFMSTSFLRGLTFDDALIVIDEFQNMTFHELSTVLMRVGNNSKVIVCGDIEQDDLGHKQKRESTGAEQFIRVAQKMKCFDVIRFNENDIVRSGFVKQFILAARQV